MNRTLLSILVSAACSGVAFAAINTPVVYDYESFIGVSADGRIAVSEVNGSPTIYNLADGTSKVYTDEGYGAFYGVAGLSVCDITGGTTGVLKLAK